MEYIYAALLLHKLGKEVSEEGIKAVVSASGVAVDNDKVKSLVASLKGVDIASELANASFAQASAPQAHAAEAPKQEAPKEEKKAAAAEGLASLFG